MTRKTEISEYFWMSFPRRIDFILLWESMVICVKLELLLNDMAKVKEVYLVSLMD